MSVFLALLLTLRKCARARAVLPLEVPALRHQLQVLQRTRPRRVVDEVHHICSPDSIRARPAIISA